MTIIELANSRPVRLDGTEDVPIRWLFKSHFIELLWNGKYYVCQVRPMLPDGRVLDTLLSCFPVRKYKDLNETTKHVNRCLQGLCATIDRNTHLIASADSYTQDGRIISFLQSVEHSTTRYKIKIVGSELFAARQVGKQLAFL